MSKTLSQILNKLRQKQAHASLVAHAVILERNALEEKDIDGVHLKLEKIVANRGQGDDMVQYRLYQLVDAETVYIESLVRARTESGLDQFSKKEEDV